jgi:two-component system CheB/CheR fusion protein
MADADQDVRHELAAVQRALRQSEQEAQTLFDSSVFGRAEADATTSRFRRVNDCFCAITGYARAELLGMPIHELTHPDDRAEDRPKFESMMRGDVPEYVAEKRYLRKDGRVIWVRVAAQVIRDEHGAPLYTTGIVSEITLRKEAEAERERVVATLAARVQAQDKFMAMLAHELRNPLAPIRNSCFVLDQAERDSEPARRARAIIERQVAHMSHLIDELLDVTRIVTGKIQLHPAPVELRELVARTLLDHQSTFAALGVDLALDPSSARCWVNADAVRLVQVFGNLLGNAAKFTPRGGKVVVALSADAAHAQAVLSVRDTGVGIAPELMPVLFEPFMQATTSLDRGTGGLGLGLAVVKGLVEMHGGAVEAYSAGIDSGAELVLRLPLIAARGDQPIGDTSPGARVVGIERVLLIEDNLDAAETLRLSLELCRHRVEVAHDGPTGIALAHAFAPDVVVCDIGLPGMDGYAVARALRADPVLHAVPMVALSGYASATDKAAAREAGFNTHLAKPVSVQDLRDTFARIAAR